MSEVTTTPTTVAYRDEGFLAAGISASATTITIGSIYKYVSGVKTLQGLDSTSGYAEISYGDRREIISFGASSVHATTKVTTWTDVRRGLPQTNTTANFTAGTGIVWPKGATVRVIDYSNYIHQTAFKDAANTFTANQTISSTNELRFADSATAVWDDGTSLSFKDSTTATKTLAQLAAAAGTDEKTKVSINDTTGDYLLNKLAAGTGVTLTETNDGGDEDITIAAVNTVDTGHTGLSTITTGGLLVGAGTSNMTIIGPGTTGQVPLSNGTTIVMGTPPTFDRVLYVAPDNTAAVGASSTAEVDTDNTYTLGAADATVGATYRFYASGKYTMNSGTLTVKLKAGAVTLFSLVSSTTGSNKYWELSGQITCQSTGASGAFSFGFFGMVNSATPTLFTQDGNTAITIDTTGTNVLKTSAQFSASDAGHAFTMTNFTIERLSSTAA